MAQTHTNQAYVTYSYEGASGPQTNESNMVTSTRRDRYDFSVEKTATTDCFRAGENITFFIHISNTGCRCLGKFYICDNLGGNEYLSYVEGSARLMVGGSLIEITPTNTYPLEFEISHNLEKNESMFLQYTATVSSSISTEVESITNKIEVRACPCGNCEDNEQVATGTGSNCISKTATSTISRCDYAELLITKQVSSTDICCDDEVDYFITLTNTGTIDATNIIVTDSLPEEFTLMEISTENNGDVYVYDASEYNLSAANFLTLPNATGTAIYVPAVSPGVDNTTRIKIHGHM